MPSADSVKLIECPRDAWQGLKGQVPAEIKINYLKTLISAGFKHIDAVSFISPKAVPQMADHTEVLERIRRKPGVSYPVLAPNLKGFEAARAAGPLPLRAAGAGDRGDGGVGTGARRGARPAGAASAGGARPEGGGRRWGRERR